MDERHFNSEDPTSNCYRKLKSFTFFIKNAPLIDRQRDQGWWKAQHACMVDTSILINCNKRPFHTKLLNSKKKCSCKWFSKSKITDKDRFDSQSNIRPICSVNIRRLVLNAIANRQYATTPPLKLRSTWAKNLYYYNLGAHMAEV